MFFLVGIVTIIGMYFINVYITKRRHLPPGPIPLPFFGNILAFVKTPMDVKLQQWKDYYGDIMTVWIGSTPIVTLHDPNVILKTFVKDGDTFAGRARQRFNELMRPGAATGYTGLIFSDGHLWREHRKFALHAFRNLGLGRNVMQERVLNEVCSLLDHTKSELNSGQKEFNFFNELDISVGSVINIITFGYRFLRDDRSEFTEVKKIAVRQVKFGGSVMFRTMEGYYEFFRWLPGFNAVYADVVDHVEKVREFLARQIRIHREHIDFESDEEATDYVEAFLRHQYTLNKDGVKDHLFTEAQLHSALLDLWVAGQETTTTTLAWMIIYMIKNPEVQQKVQTELTENIGDRLVTLDDKISLNYVNAVIAESQRIGNLVAMNVPHRTTRDVKIMGYDIPADTVIVNQISTILMDERYFPNANTFKPERFLDDCGKFNVPSEFFPFSVGKRACLGEGLARLELFLFTSNLLNQFEFFEIPEKPVSAKRIVGGTTGPAPWICGIRTRY